MNRISSRIFGIASLIVGGSIVLGGCGPQDLNDPEYMAQLKDAGIDNAEDKMPGQDTAAPAMGDQQQAMPQGQEPQGQNMPQDQAQPVEGTPVAAAPVAGVAAVPVVPAIPVVALPPGFVREPDLVNPLPTTVVNTGEVRPVARVVEHYREILQPQDNVRIHNIHQPYSEHHRFRQRVINIPTARTVITTSNSAAFTQEILPTEIVSLPLVDYGPVFAGCGGGFGGWGGWGGGGYCATPFYGRGAYFGCSRPLF